MSCVNSRNATNLLLLFKFHDDKIQEYNTGEPRLHPSVGLCFHKLRHGKAQIGTQGNCC